MMTEYFIFIFIYLFLMILKIYLTKKSNIFTIDTEKTEKPGSLVYFLNIDIKST